MIPLANLLFVWTNIVGAALWVADEIEQEESRMQQEQASHGLIGGTAEAGSYNPGNQFQMTPQMHTLSYPQQHEQYLVQQHSSLSSPYAHQGSARIPPKDKKHPEV